MGLISKMKEKFYGALSALESRDMELHRVRVLVEDICRTCTVRSGTHERSICVGALNADNVRLIRLTEKLAVSPTEELSKLQVTLLSSF